jgi:hypothetical protein
MGIVLNQSLKTIITYIGFGIGAINTIYLYPFFLGATYCKQLCAFGLKYYHAVVGFWDAKYLS